MRAICFGALALTLLVNPGCEDDGPVGVSVDASASDVPEPDAGGDVGEPEDTAADVGADDVGADDAGPDVSAEDTAGEDIAGEDAALEDVEGPDADDAEDIDEPGDTDAPGDADTADADEGSACGGFAGLTCDEAEFCSYEPGTFCGGDDSLGECLPRPADCTGQPSEPVCGCDGQPYAGECQANRAGTSAAAEGVCDGQCLTDSDCEMSFSFCVQPDAPPTCGICFNPLEPTCETDGECGEGQVCDNDETPCLCEPQKVCQPACTPGSCEVGESCGDDGHCAPSACATATDCPMHFACTDGACARATCTQQTGCADGFCVQGECYGQPGFCELPKP